MGAALLAGVGAHIYPDVRAACQQAVRWREEVVRPDPENAALYDTAYDVFRQLYPALKSITGEDQGQ